MSDHNKSSFNRVRKDKTHLDVSPKQDKTLSSDRSQHSKILTPNLSPSKISHTNSSEGQDNKDLKKSSLASSSDRTKEPKFKQEITTLEQFIAAVYAKKGKPLSLKTKGLDLNAISKDTQISAQSAMALRPLIDSDNSFCVPHQILFAAKEIEHHPKIKEALKNFVQGVMLAHPIYRNAEVISAIKTLADPALQKIALKSVMTEVLIEIEFKNHNPSEQSTKKAIDINELRSNATSCLAVWFWVGQNSTPEHVMEGLYEAVWKPATYVAATEAARLKKVTASENIVGMGFVYDFYKRKALTRASEAAQANLLLNEVRQAQAIALEEIKLLKQSLSETQAAYSKYKEDTNEKITNLVRTHEIEVTHLKDDIENIKSRVLRRLLSDGEMLGVGLSAIEGVTPKIHVVRDKVERVIESLQKETEKLRET
jgi:hypothetical protein